MSNRIFVPTSFVWHIHNQGVSSAPSQGRALWTIFLPTTGSFFVYITDFAPTTAPFGGRFPVVFCFTLPWRAYSSFTSWLLSIVAGIGCQGFPRSGAACPWQLIPAAIYCGGGSVFMLPAVTASAVFWCRSASSRHHSQPLLSGSYMPLSGTYRPPPPATVFSLKDSPAGAYSNHAVP